MSTNLANQSPFIRTSRSFPTDSQALSVELDRSYLDIASTINARTISLFPTARQTQSGENWFITKNQRQSGFRQVYQCSDTALTIPHGINLASVTNFVRVWGVFYTGSVWTNLPYIDVVNANNQIKITVDATNIVIVKGGGSPPSISQGTIVLEWLVNP